MFSVIQTVIFISYFQSKKFKFAHNAFEILNYSYINYTEIYIKGTLQNRI